MPKKGLSKSESREKRKKEKQEKNKSKNIRLSSSIIFPEREIRTTAIPEITSRSPRSGISEFDYLDKVFEWNVLHADLEGDWSWNEPRQWSDCEFAGIIEPHFNSMLNNTWREVENQKYNGKGGHRKKLNKYQSINSICKEAQQRWKENDTICQFEDLFRCRLGTYRRTWGIRILNHYFLIWYERNHNICPPIDD